MTADTNKPPEGAMRAAEAILKLQRSMYDPSGTLGEPEEEDLAELIDEHTGLAEKDKQIAELAKMANALLKVLHAVATFYEADRMGDDCVPILHAQAKRELFDAANEARKLFPRPNPAALSPHSATPQEKDDG